MDSIVFCVVHHATSDLHLDVFNQCISSIIKFHPNNKIFVCKTAVSPMPDYILIHDNVTYVTTPVEGSHIYGAISILLQITNITNYVLMHDSMILMKPLDEMVLNKRFYFLWHFHSAYHDHKDIVMDLISNNKFDHENKCVILDKYNNYPGQAWFGLFGPAFGGKIEHLKILCNMLDSKFGKVCG